MARPPSVSTRPEQTGRRPTAISRWHRSLPPWVWCCDLDAVEVRSGRGPVAIIEYAELPHPPTVADARRVALAKRLQREVLAYLATATGLPAYITVHDPDLEAFVVLRVGEGLEARAMTEPEYRAFLETL